LYSTPRSQFRLALKDLKEGISSIHVWPMLGWLEIKQRYRRSVLGPFWLTISTGVMLAGMGPLYSKLFGQPMSVYFSYLAIGFVVWIFISGLINDACMTFIQAEGYIKQMKLPLTVHVMRTVWKNLLIFFHNLVIVLIVLVFYQPKVDWHILLIPIGILLVALNGLWAGVLLGLVCARFRDIPLIVASLVQVAFFLTPVFWMPGMLGRHQWAADVNPLFHFLEIIRRPLMGENLPVLSWMVVLAITVAGFTVMFAFFQRYRARVAYWV
jgi:homopolymeric O-antigen transport system permease protein